ncbi:MAG: hypothetical protein ACYC3S_14325 [Chloroflexota bacterium]
MEREYELEQLHKSRHRSLVNEAAVEHVVLALGRERQLTDHDAEKHRLHLCHLAETRQMATVASLIGDGKYICGHCGRVAAKPDNLCNPLEREA